MRGMISLLLGCLLVDPVAATDLHGTLQWTNRIELGTLVSGVVQEVRVKAGQKVRAGDALLRLDDREFRSRIVASRADLARANAHYAEAKREAERADELYERTVLSDHELQLAKIGLQEALSGVQIAQARLAEAQLDLERSRIVAPYDALVLRVDASPGMVIVNELKSRPLLTIADYRHLTANALATIDELADVEVGTPAQIGVRGDWLDATVQRIGLEPQPDLEGEARYPLSVDLQPPETLRLFIGEPVLVRIPRVAMP